MQRDYMDSRNITGNMVEELIRNHRAYTEAKARSNEKGAERGAGQGVEAGSFVDLLVNGKDKATGAPFSDNVLAQQVRCGRLSYNLSQLSPCQLMQYSDLCEWPL